MNLLREYIRELLKEEMSQATVGSVLDALDVMKDIKNRQQRKELLLKLAKKFGWEMVKFIPLVGSGIKAVKSLGDLYKLAKDTPDAKVKKDNIVFDMLDIDDKYQEMLDDELEDLFDSKVIPKLKSMPRDADLPDMNDVLEKWIKQKFDKRGIHGADT